MPDKKFTTLAQNTAVSHSEAASIEFGIDSKINRINKIKACVVVKNNGDGTVDIRPLIATKWGGGLQTPQATIYGVLIQQWQHGTSAIVMQPEAGDIGLVGFEDRDTSILKKNGTDSPQGSNHTHSLMDGFYLGATEVFNKKPTQTIVFDGNGITINSPLQVTVNTPQATLNCDQAATITGKGTFTVNYPTINFNGKSTFTGQVFMNGKEVDETHTHTSAGSGYPTSGVL